MALLPTLDAPPCYLTRAQLAQMPGMREETIGGIRVHTGNTMELLADAARHSGYESKDHSWSGASMDVALALGVVGWHEAVKSVEDLYVRLTAKHTNSIIPTLEYSDEPDGDVDVERWSQGDDECFLVETHSAFTVNVAGTYATFVLDPFASCGKSADVVLQRGVYLAALVYLMERAGYRTEITLRMPTNDFNDGGSKRYRLEVAVKEFGHMLDLPRVLYWLAHPAVLRQIVIGFYRKYRNDSIYSDSDYQPVNRPGVIEAPPLTWSLDLDAWIVQTLKQSGLSFEV